MLSGFERILILGCILAILFILELQCAVHAKISSYTTLLKDRKKEGSLRFYKPKFSYIFCDMDGEVTHTF